MAAGIKEMHDSQASSRAPLLPRFSSFECRLLIFIFCIVEILWAYTQWRPLGTGPRRLLRRATESLSLQLLRKSLDERSCLTPYWQLATSHLLAVMVDAFLVVMEVVEALLVLIEQLQMLLSLSMINRLELISRPGEAVAILGFREQHISSSASKSRSPQPSPT
jgi:hypothetical protein